MERQENPQPAVLVGGPPHAGKSVLTYSLTRALRQYGIAHYVMCAAPDGEGHWSQETPEQVREIIRRKGAFSDPFLMQNGFILLHCVLHNHNLDYSQLNGLNAPPLSTRRGLVLSGRLPLWLMSALSGLYCQIGLPWIAGYYPQSQGALVVCSRVPDHAPGDLMPVRLSSQSH